MTTAEQQARINAYLGPMNLDMRPGDRLPWKAWERAVYKVSWRAAAAGFALMTVGLQVNLWQQPWFLPVSGVLLNAIWLTHIAVIPPFIRFRRVCDILNPPQPRRKHVCIDQCNHHREDYL